LWRKDARNNVWRKLFSPLGLSIPLKDKQRKKDNSLTEAIKEGCPARTGTHTKEVQSRCRRGSQTLSKLATQKRNSLSRSNTPCRRKAPRGKTKSGFISRMKGFGHEKEAKEEAPQRKKTSLSVKKRAVDTFIYRLGGGIGKASILDNLEEEVLQSRSSRKVYGRSRQMKGGFRNHSNIGSKRVLISKNREQSSLQ